MFMFFSLQDLLDCLFYIISSLARNFVQDLAKIIRQLDFIIDKFFTNFDDGFGMWYNVNRGQNPLKWRRGRGQLSSLRSGPQGDHTDGKGGFAKVIL